MSGKVREISNELIDEIKQAVADADKVLIGIGTEWMADGKASDLMNGYQISDDDKEKILTGYKEIKSLIKDKDYYIMSLCYDDLIYEVFADEDNVVTPCGGYRLLQCGQHIMTKDEVKLIDGKPSCPLCGGDLSFNNIENEQYMEEGYLVKFGEYKAWLQSTINKKLVIIELGANMQFPSVIRFAFDRLCQYNLKSTFYRVNESLYQHAAESEERGISIKGKSLSLFNDMK